MNVRQFAKASSGAIPSIAAAGAPLVDTPVAQAAVIVPRKGSDQQHLSISTDIGNPRSVDIESIKMPAPPQSQLGAPSPLDEELKTLETTQGALLTQLSATTDPNARLKLQAQLDGVSNQVASLVQIKDEIGRLSKSPASSSPLIQQAIAHLMQDANQIGLTSSLATLFTLRLDGKLTMRSALGGQPITQQQQQIADQLAQAYAANDNERQALLMQLATTRDPAMRAQLEARLQGVNAQAHALSAATGAYEHLLVAKATTPQARQQLAQAMANFQQLVGQLATTTDSAQRFKLGLQLHLVANDAANGQPISEQQQQIVDQLAAAYTADENQRHSLQAQLATVHEPAARQRLQSQISAIDAQEQALQGAAGAFNHLSQAKPGSSPAQQQQLAQAMANFQQLVGQLATTTDSAQRFKLGLQLHLLANDAASGQPISEQQQQIVDQLAAAYTADENQRHSLQAQLATVHEPAARQRLQSQISAIDAQEQALQGAAGAFNHLSQAKPGSSPAQQQQLAQAMANFQQLVGQLATTTDSAQRFKLGLQLHLVADAAHAGIPISEAQQQTADQLAAAYQVVSAQQQALDAQLASTSDPAQRHVLEVKSALLMAKASGLEAIGHDLEHLARANVGDSQTLSQLQALAQQMTTSTQAPQALVLQAAVLTEAALSITGRVPPA